MIEYEIVFYPAADKDMAKLDGSERKLVFKALQRVKGNPPFPRKGAGMASRSGTGSPASWPAT